MGWGVTVTSPEPLSSHQVHRSHAGRGRFRDSAKRLLHAADSIGIRGILAHAISDDAKAFYPPWDLTSPP